MIVKSLTRNQREVLEAIEDYIADNNCSPTYSEIAQMTNKSSIGGVSYTVSVLEKKGYITTTLGKSRSIRLAGDEPRKPCKRMKGIVLCKDCRYRHKTNMGVAIWMMCHRLGRKTDDDFYCAYGEVKE